MRRIIITVAAIVAITCTMGFSQIAFAAQNSDGFTAVAGTDKVVFDQRKKNNTALAVVAGVGTLVLFTIGLTATRKRTKNSF